jgi:hypothetical protein
MSKKSLIVCDCCDKECTQEHPKGWIHINMNDIGVFNGTTIRSSQKVYAKDFCDTDCFTEVLKKHIGDLLTSKEI